MISKVFEDRLTDNTTYKDASLCIKSSALNNISRDNAGKMEVVLQGMMDVSAAMRKNQAAMRKNQAAMMKNSENLMDWSLQSDFQMERASLYPLAVSQSWMSLYQELLVMRMVRPVMLMFHLVQVYTRLAMIFPPFPTSTLQKTGFQLLDFGDFYGL